MNPFPTYLLLPALAAVIFAVASLAYKRAFQEGALIRQAFLINNLALALAFLPLALAMDRPVPWQLWHQPVLAGVAFLAGVLLQFGAIRLGDVSLVTPLLGTKLVFIALLARFVFQLPLTASQVTAAILSAIGVFLLGATDIQPRRRVGLATGFVLQSCLAFALCDVLVQIWAADFGAHAFLPLLFLSVALLSVLALPLVPGSIRVASRAAWKWLIVGAILTAIQALMIGTTIALWRDATGVNVVYSLRGLWGIMLVWVVGHWFKNRERHEAGPRAMALRLAGSLLILWGVTLVVLSTPGTRPP